MRKKNIELFIDGRFEPAQAGATFTSVDPASEDVIADVALAEAADVDRAVAAARRAFDQGPWPRMRAAERAEYLRAIADAIEENLDTLALLESIDTGLPVMYTSGHVMRAVTHFRYFAEEAERIGGTTHPQDRAYIHVVTREPIGVVAIVTSWNAPISLATSGAAAALTCGNTCVLKPSEFSPVTAAELAKIVEALELPPGVLNVIHGPGLPTGDALVGHPGVDAIGFTGGSATGRRIMARAAGSLKRFVGELGGNAPTLVFADADLDRVVDGTILCAFANNGEVCVAGSRLLVEQPVYQAFVDRFTARARNIRVGEPQQPDTELGPLISEQHRERLQGMIAAAVAGGATLRCGGERVSEQARGYYLAPTVLTDVAPGGRIVQEEILGPVVTIAPFTTEAEALERANGTIYGLAGYVWTRSAERIFRVSAGLRVGTVWANSALVRDVRVPFGGYKQSGVGRLGGQHSIEAFTEVKNTCIAIEPYALPALGAQGREP
jgi:5-carboxymethyl-2-hydroxymuconic-semialdehyde dehydrogenase